MAEIYENALSKLNPTENSIIFKFLDNHENGQFVDRNTSGLVEVVSEERQIHKPRWAKVIKVGGAGGSIKSGMYALIIPLQWTTALSFRDEEFWITDVKQVLCYSDADPYEAN